MFAPKLLIIFLDETDRYGDRAMHDAVMDMLERADVAGATVLRGIRAFHSLRAAPELYFPTDRPVAVMGIDDESHLRALLPRLQEMTGAAGLMLLTDVEVLAGAEAGVAAPVM